MAAYLRVVENEKTGRWHGARFRLHPAEPDGPFRPNLTRSSFASPLEAADFINATYPLLPQINLAFMPHAQAPFLTQLPKRLTVTVVAPRAAGEEQYIELTVDNVVLPLHISRGRFMDWQAAGIIELDSSSGCDPELSARYDHYFLTKGES